MDPQWFTRLAAGDEQAFRVIFDHYKEPFFAAAFKMTRSQAIAEEIVQDLFVRAWDKREKFAQANNPNAYLYRMLHNNIYEHFRKVMLDRKLHSKLAVANPDIDDNDIEQNIYERENLAALTAVIERLPAQQKLVYKLSRQEGLSREEIAEQLNISPNTVRNHLVSATEFIKKSLSALIWAAIWQSL